MVSVLGKKAKGIEVLKTALHHAPEKYKFTALKQLSSYLFTIDFQCLMK